MFVNIRQNTDTRDFLANGADLDDYQHEEEKLSHKNNGRNGILFDFTFGKQHASTLYKKNGVNTKIGT